MRRKEQMMTAKLKKTKVSGAKKTTAANKTTNSESKSVKATFGQWDERLTELEKKAGETFGGLVDKTLGNEPYKKMKDFSEVKIQELGDRVFKNDKIQQWSDKVRSSKVIVRADELTQEVAQGFEKRLESSMERLFSTLGLATQNEVKKIDRRIRNLSRKVTNMGKNTDRAA
jgi:polyhydroxyalkanoate synthesis regulator phasin